MQSAIDEPIDPVRPPIRDRLGVLTVPQHAAQDAAELMVRAGIRGSGISRPSKLQVPQDVVTQKEDLAEGLAVLSHRLQHFMPQSPATGG